MVCHKGPKMGWQSNSAFIMVSTVFLVFLASVASVSSESTNKFGDVRCKCICPPVVNNTKVFKKELSDPKDCKCEYMVPNFTEDLCDKCECKWERRNTRTIQVVVIIILCIIGILVLYMLFLLCLDPLMSRRPHSYLEQRNEEDTQSVTITSNILDEPGPRSRQNIVTRVKTEVGKVREEQQKWKGTVQEQRRHIYDRHLMLN